VWVQRLAEFAEQLAQGVALKIGLDMLAVAVLDPMSGGVVAVGLCSAIKAFFFDQTFVAVVGEGVAVAVFVDQLWVHFTHHFLFMTDKLGVINRFGCRCKCIVVHGMYPTWLDAYNHFPQNVLPCIYEKDYKMILMSHVRRSA